MADEPIVLHVLEALEGGTARHVVDIVRHVPATHHVAIPTRRVGGLTDEPAAPAIPPPVPSVHHVEMRTVAPLRSPTPAVAPRACGRLVRRDPT